MRRSWLLNAALLAVIAALASFIYFKPKQDDSGTYPLSMLKADEITRLRIERAARPPLVLKKTGRQWLITAPIAARADAFQVQRLLSILDARASSRLAATDLARFDLDRPGVRLTLGDQNFSFGMINAASREQYVLTANAVYTVSLRYGAALPNDVTPLISKQLFAESEVPVSFKFSNFSVRRVDGIWRVSPTDGANATAVQSQDDIHRWVDDWRMASALRVSPHAASRAHDEIKIGLENGAELTLNIVQREPELVLQRPDLGLQYSFFVDVAKRLLAPPTSLP